MKIKVVETIVEDGSGVGKTFTIERVRKEGLPQRTRLGDPLDGMGGEGSVTNGQGLPHQLEDVMDLGNSMGIDGVDIQLNDHTGGGQQGLTLMTSGKVPELDQYGIPGLLGEVHRHSLEESDRIKKCTVEREGIKRQKEMKKVQVSLAKSTIPNPQTIAHFFSWGFIGMTSSYWIGPRIRHRGLGFCIFESDDIASFRLISAFAFRYHSHGKWGECFYFFSLVFSYSHHPNFNVIFFHYIVPFKAAAGRCLIEAPRRRLPKEERRMGKNNRRHIQRKPPGKHCKQ